MLLKHLLEILPFGCYAGYHCKSLRQTPASRMEHCPSQCQVRTLYYLVSFLQEIFNESDALSEAPDHPTDVVPEEQRSESADVLGAISVVNTVDDLSINEEDKLQSLVAEMLNQDVPIEVLLLAASGMRNNILLRLKSATPVEGRFWKGVTVALLKWMRPLRQKRRGIVCRPNKLPKLIGNAMLFRVLLQTQMRLNPLQQNQKTPRSHG